MGKTKNNKFKRPQFSPDGLAATAVKNNSEDEAEDEEDSSATELLDKLLSPSADVREYACANISRVVQQTQSIPGFLRRDVVKKLGPLLLDRSLAVRETAAGALRNLSACGGAEVCEDMVRQDALTPLSALLREQCCADFDGVASSAKNGQKRVAEDVAVEAVNLLWNLW
ncbi:hypothetical protein DNTS_022285 [Danionella cerebrum]|uniref:Condensin complex subunit 1 C-terminal domain-containing protein n=1 Tax=Danionella cerebrum TaxID=2873325 RepID=A0A553NIA0_9TELE|nr:hypothetical protein DNTS_022285 [Danionella translucida]